MLGSLGTVSSIGSSMLKKLAGAVSEVPLPKPATMTTVKTQAVVETKVIPVPSSATRGYDDDDDYLPQDRQEYLITKGFYRSSDRKTSYVELGLSPTFSNHMMNDGQINGLAGGSMASHSLKEDYLNQLDRAPSNSYYYNGSTETLAPKCDADVVLRPTQDPFIASNIANEIWNFLGTTTTSTKTSTVSTRMKTSCTRTTAATVRRTSGNGIWTRRTNISANRTPSIEITAPGRTRWIWIEIILPTSIAATANRPSKKGKLHHEASWSHHNTHPAPMSAMPMALVERWGYCYFLGSCDDPWNQSCREDNPLLKLNRIDNFTHSRLRVSGRKPTVGAIWRRRRLWIATTTMNFHPRITMPIVRSALSTLARGVEGVSHYIIRRLAKRGFDDEIMMDEPLHPPRPTMERRKLTPKERWHWAYNKIVHQLTNDILPEYYLPLHDVNCLQLSDRPAYDGNDLDFRIVWARTILLNKI
ncbi:unnamed protein product [Nesidiocoris tenuis]|uniref:Uncharacterized protein n=1 Tax=Nesidiocoris tenuis TaxID=355587 RepID=A0A6H5GLN7_9HEMI|nr:unnamed protein product [Nesidiocoris tenuis]